MTIDKSLRVKRGASRNRSVLTRVERLQRLKEADRWKDGDSPLGLPKVRVRKMTLKKKKKKKEGEEARCRRWRCCACRRWQGSRKTCRQASGQGRQVAIGSIC